ncbi:MAG TPA: transcriptional regulator [Nitrospinae bacterium]|nr:transcriptional regulator [Nitrospinota bacterium]
MLRTIERPLTPTEVADLFTVSVDTLKKWRVKGEGPDFYKIGRVVRYDLSSVQKYMKANLTHITEKSR